MQNIKKATPNKEVTSTTKDIPSTSKKVNHQLGIRSLASKLAIKCYDEQLVDSWEHIQEKIKAISTEKYIVLAIKHDSDEVYDKKSPWVSAIEKPHYHFIFNVMNKKSRPHIQTLLNMISVHFRNPVDNKLWANHGVEAISDFASMAQYLPHDTEEAIKAGKHQYPLSDVITNLCLEELENLMNGSYRLIAKQKLKLEDYEYIERQAHKAGFSYSNWEQFRNTLPLNVRTSRYMREIERQYGYGIEKRVNLREPIIRCCIFIQGLPNTGKTTCSIKALQDIGIKLEDIYVIDGGGGTGKYDNLLPSHKAIVLSDSNEDNLLAMSDNYVNQVYRRNNNNPVFTGNYFIVTSNKDFKAWAKDCKFNTKTIDGEDDEKYKALESRFFICRTKNDEDGKYWGYLDVLHKSKRGTPEQADKRNAMFSDFHACFFQNSYEFMMNFNGI